MKNKAWIIGISNDPLYLEKTDSPWSKVCDLADDSIPGLVLTYLRTTQICFPFFAFNEGIKSNRVTRTEPLTEWIERLNTGDTIKIIILEERQNAHI